MMISQLLSLISPKSLRTGWTGLCRAVMPRSRRHRVLHREIQAAEQRVLLSSALVSGQSLSTSISAGGEQDVYTFQAVKGNAVTLNLARTTINYVPVVDIFSPTGRQIYDGQAAGSPAFDILLNTFSESGAYTVIVKASTLTGVGSYNLTYVGLAGVQTLPVDEGALTSGVTRPGTITAADIDLYTFQATAGNSVTLNLAVTSSELTPEVDVFAPNGALVYDGPAEGLGSFDLLLNQFPQTGTYTVLVKASNGGNEGTYNLTYVKAAATQTLPADEGTLVSGVTLAGTITPGDIDVYLFQATVGNAVTIDLAKTTLGYTPEVDIFAPNGSQVYDGVASGLGSFDVVLNSFTQTGIYTVIVKASDGGSAGNYNMTYVQVPAAQTLPVSEGVLTSGVTRSGTITAADIDVYTFQATAGNAVTLNVARTTTFYTIEVDVFAPNGDLVFNGPTGGVTSSDVFLNTFTQTGTYTVVVKASDGGGTGTYNLSYVKVAGTHTLPVDEGVLTSGVTKSGTITPSDIDVYTFQAVPGSAVTLNLSRTTIEYSPEVDVFAPNGDLVYTGPVAGAASYDLLLNTFVQSGTYTVLVKASTGGSVGDYNMTFVQTPGTHTLTADEGALTSGVTLSGTIILGDVDVYTFSAIAGNSVTINVASTTPNYFPEVDIFAPNGALVYDGPTTGSPAYDLLLNTFTQNGTYTVLVKSNNGGTLGNYNLTYVKTPAVQAFPAGEGALTSGNTISGTIIPGDIDVYTFQAVPGNAATLVVARTTTGYLPEVDIFGPTGALVYDGPANGAATYNLTLNTFPLAGKYTVLVKSSTGGGTGEYFLRYTFYATSPVPVASASLLSNAQSTPSLISAKPRHIV